MKVLVVLVDGIGDVDETPLQKAYLPTFDMLAQQGVCGLMDPVEPGLACGSDTAHLSLFGYDPRQWYRGRGAFESIGSGLQMLPGDVAFKSNFATLKDGIVISRRADRSFEMEGPVLCQYLTAQLPQLPEWNSDYEVSFQYATEHRCGVRIRGSGLYDGITGTDPLKDNLPLVDCKATDQDSRSQFTSGLVNLLSTCVTKLLQEHPINKQRSQLNKQPANCVLFRGAGMILECPSFQLMHPELGKSFGIAPTCMISGLLQMINIEVVTVKGATGSYDSDFDAKGSAAVAKFKDGYDFGFLHIKAIDDAGHDKLYDEKVLQLEKVDRMLKLIVESMTEPFVIVVTGDHSTPVLEGDHSCEPVPVSITTLNLSNTMKDEVAKFDEVAVARGALGRFRGLELMSLLKRLSGKKYELQI